MAGLITELFLVRQRGFQPLAQALHLKLLREGLDFAQLMGGVRLRQRIEPLSQRHNPAFARVAEQFVKIGRRQLRAIADRAAA